MLAELVQYAQLLNVLLIPAVIWIVKLERRLVEMASAIQAHASLDLVIFEGMRRDLDRVDGSTGAAHRRMDQLGIKSSGA